MKIGAILAILISFFSFMSFAKDSNCFELLQLIAQLDRSRSIKKPQYLRHEVTVIDNPELLPQVYPVLDFLFIPRKSKNLPSSTIEEHAKHLEDEYLAVDGLPLERSLTVSTTGYHAAARINVARNNGNFFYGNTRPSFHFSMGRNPYQLIRETSIKGQDQATWEEAFFIMQTVISAGENNPGKAKFMADVFGAEYVLDWSPELRKSFNDSFLEALHIRFNMDARGINWINQPKTIEEAWAQVSNLQGTVATMSKKLEMETREALNNFKNTFQKSDLLSEDQYELFESVLNEIVENYNTLIGKISKIHTSNQNSEMLETLRELYNKELLDGFFQSMRRNVDLSEEGVRKLNLVEAKFDEFFFGKNSLYTWYPYFERLAFIIPGVERMLSWMMFASTNQARRLHP